MATLDYWKVATKKNTFLNSEGAIRSQFHISMEKMLGSPKKGTKEKGNESSSKDSNHRFSAKYLFVFGGV